jgi:hypothetical protein
MKLDDNDIPTESKSLLDPLEILSAKVKGIGFKSMMVICPDSSMGVKYSLIYPNEYTGKQHAFTFRLNGCESLIAISDPEFRAKWRQRVLSDAIACIDKASR